MSERKYSSTAVATTLSGSANSSTTSIAVVATTGWPSTFPFTIVLDEDTATEELASVTAIGGLTLTVTRGVDGTTGQAHSAGATARHGFSAQDFREPQQHMVATTGVHGATGAVVGTTDTQTLTNKTLTTPAINGGTVTSATLVTPTIASLANANHDHSNSAGGANIPQASVTSLVSDLALKETVVNVDAHTSATVVHGVSGAVVGTTNTQTLTNKTISGASNSFADIPDAAVTNLPAYEVRITDLETGPTYADYTPTLSASGGGSPTLSTATVTARYSQHGKKVHCYGRVQLGVSTNFGTGVLRVALPVSATAASNTGLGTMWIRDASASADWHGFVVLEATTYFTTRGFMGPGTSDQISGSTSTPMAWTSGDWFSWDFVYEAA